MVAAAIRHLAIFLPLLHPDSRPYLHRHYRLEAYKVHNKQIQVAVLQNPQVMAVAPIVVVAGLTRLLPPLPVQHCKYPCSRHLHHHHHPLHNTRMHSHRIHNRLLLLLVSCYKVLVAVLVFVVQEAVATVVPIINSSTLQPSSQAAIMPTLSVVHNTKYRVHHS
ncbi:unnamed protein product [Meganyctiphanes norvegica]|uniref:Secreted protein n=1 Tax=Meganyctiphanes norvegica TaxID=48144 RepID=A0AAV2R5X0_MEGNR